MYVRYSSHSQDGNTSVDVQIETCKRAIRAAGGDPDKAVTYSDEAKTGRVVGGRDALKRMMQDARRGKVSRIFVFKWDRLGRSLADTAALVKQLERLGVTIVSATEGKDKLTRGVLLSVAEWYSDCLGERTTAGLRQRFNERAHTGNRAYGYRVVERDGKKRLA